MIKLHEQQSVFIRQSTEVVFAYISNLENLMVWSSVFASVRLVPPLARQAGAVMRCTIYFAKKRMDFTFEIIEYEPGSVFTLKSIAGIAPCYIHFQLAKAACGGTNLTREATVQLMENNTTMDDDSLIQAIREQLSYNLLALKDILESWNEMPDSATDQ